MNERKKRLVERSKRDVAKAGRMFLDAVFGDTEEFLDGLDDADEQDDGGDECDDDALTVQGYTTDEESAPSTKPYGNGNPR
ncbi:MAG TPA: hypothetical protein VIF62_13430 [Labilithrix sp.]